MFKPMRVSTIFFKPNIQSFSGEDHALRMPEMLSFYLSIKTFSGILSGAGFLSTRHLEFLQNPPLPSPVVSSALNKASAGVC